ncbi:MAG: hypothetical protein J6Q54_02395 [Oscillospiraceae bacterium]|nr:hypothetical protein [Oscillospiraceae bacterium]
MSDTGYIQVYAYASNARIPLKDVAIVITNTGGEAIAMRLTNRSGKLDQPIEIEVPQFSASQAPDTGIIPFASVNLYARLKDYEQIEIENLQVFPQTTTDQDLQMIPLAEFPDSWSKTEIFNTPPQNL